MQFFLEAVAYENCIKEKKEMNTKINYMYRDAANYKIRCEEVVKGEIDEKVCKEILEDIPIIRRISG